VPARWISPLPAKFFSTASAPIPATMRPSQNSVAKKSAPSVELLYHRGKTLTNSKYVRWVFLFITVWVSSVIPVSGQVKPSPELALKIWAERSTIAKGHSVLVHIELTNQADHDLFVLRQLSPTEGNGSSLQFKVLNDAGLQSPHTTVVLDRFGTSGMALPVAVLMAWVALPPKYSYHATYELTSSDYDFLKGEGTYKIVARYSSKGIKGQVISWHMADVKPQDIERLPFHSGRVKSRATPFQCALLRNL